MTRTYNTELEYVVTLPCSEERYIKMEQYFHQKYDHCRLIRDWFLLKETDIEYLKNLAEQSNE